MCGACQPDAVLRLDRPPGLERQHGDRQQLGAALPLLLPERLGHLGELLRQRLLRGSDPRLARLRRGESLRFSPRHSLNKRSGEQSALKLFACVVVGNSASIKSCCRLWNLTSNNPVSFYIQVLAYLCTTYFAVEEQFVVFTSCLWCRTPGFHSCICVTHSCFRQLLVFHDDFSLSMNPVSRFTVLWHVGNF